MGLIFIIGMGLASLFLGRCCGLGAVFVGILTDFGSVYWNFTLLAGLNFKAG
jgi:hypothetical protein